MLFIHPNGGWPWDFWTINNTTQATKFSPSEVAPCIYGGFQLGIHNGSRWCGSRSGKRFLGERPESRIVWKMSRQVDIWQYWYFHLGKKMWILGMDFCFSKTKSLDLFFGWFVYFVPWEIIIKPAFGRICVPFSNHLFRKSKKILLTKLKKSSDLKSTKISKSWWSKQNTTSGGNKTQPAVEINHVFLGWCDWTPGTEFILGVFWDVLATFPAREGLEWCVLLVS